MTLRSKVETVLMEMTNRCSVCHRKLVRGAPIIIHNGRRTCNDCAIAARLGIDSPGKSGTAKRR